MIFLRTISAVTFGCFLTSIVLSAQFITSGNTLNITLTNQSFATKDEELSPLPYCGAGYCPSNLISNNSSIPSGSNEFDQLNVSTMSHMAHMRDA